MPFAPATLSELARAGFDDVIDVRSPAEYAEDHLPAAISLPVLSNEERARVGTIYKQESPFRARKLGAAILARNAAAHLEGPLAEKSGAWRPLVYCWRGGQRSGAFATILREVGWRVETLAGGWQAWRRLVVARLYDRPVPSPVVVLDGDTGTAKTELLALVAARGLQVIDLEGLANHRGSLFGARPGGQPSQKAFEGRLAMALEALDPLRPVVVEAESSRIGELALPPRLWAAMRAAPRIAVSAPAAARAAYLARAYDDVVADAAALDRLIGLLAPLHPRERIAGWRAMAAAGAFVPLARALMEDHYDPRYARSRSRHGAPVTTLAADSLAPDALEALAGRLAAAVCAVTSSSGGPAATRPITAASASPPATIA
ncbi:MAG: tRNA 2-selenouridine(34) synthase MnmH [Rhodobacteraceae bacterium]|jgi:tRNA 2-selenouridine synthase|nr:tRNA 2-selenouridine(34) synthase MnmH [Paracoccaceae bacterium]